MSENKVYTALGLMSGTSLDGIDVALVRTDGKMNTNLIAFETYGYQAQERDVIRAAFGARHANEATKKAEETVTDAHIRAVEQFLKAHKEAKPDVIGFHGQTILHDPSQKFTWQIGHSQKLANQAGIQVVGDMRQADMKAGGQGAPLLPICHQAFAGNHAKPIAILNLGGVGNITWLGESDEDIVAFDTGPANALIDDVVKARTGKPYDSDGRLAIAGKVQNDIVKKWLAHEYFNKSAPKSLDRDEWDVGDVETLELEDAVATLAEFTVRAVATSVLKLPGQPRALYVAGGGRLNKYMMARLKEMLGFPVAEVEDLGWNGDALEAQGFAYLAVRSLLGLPLTLPSTTGVPAPTTGGTLYKGSSISALRPAK